MFKFFNKITGIIGIIFAAVFLLGITVTLDKSPMINFIDILPVWIIMIVVIFMMIVDYYNSLNKKDD